MIKAIYPYKLRALLFALLAFALSCVSIAQQEWSYTQYQFNLFDANSAYAGNHNTLSMAVRHRSQWIGLEGAPVTDQFSVHTPLAGNRIGVGFRVVSDRIGARLQQMAKGAAAYRMNVLGGSLSFAITGGILRSAIDRAELNAADMNDAQLNQLGPAYVTPVVGAACMFTSKRVFAGVESGTLNTTSMNSSSGSLARLYRNMNAVAGYIQPIGEKDLIEISTQIKWSESAQWQAEFNAFYLYRNKYWFGGGYRLGSAWQLLASWMVNEQFRIGLSYDNTAGRLLNSNQSSAELFLGYTLHKRAAGSVRYF